MQRRGGRARKREIESNQTSSIAAKMMLEIVLARRLTFQHGSSGACLFVHGTKAVTSFLPTMTILSIATNSTSRVECHPRRSKAYAYMSTASQTKPPPDLIDPLRLPPHSVHVTCLSPTPCHSHVFHSSPRTSCSRTATFAFASTRSCTRCQSRERDVEDPFGGITTSRSCGGGMNGCGVDTGSE